VFQKWSSTHNKVYATPEEKLYRLSVFINTYKTVTLHNMKNETYEQGLNAFSDMTYEEFITKYTGDLSEDKFKALGNENLEVSQAPVKAIDWTTTGAVNVIQNQGQCGGCWAFAATASFEAAYFNKFKNLMKFSEQASIDCDRGNNGCGGGSPDTAMAYQKASGLPTLADYPYTATTNQCKAQGKKASLSLAYTYNAPSSANILTGGVNVGVTYISVYVNSNF
jgi:C1A family cysteine protease